MKDCAHILLFDVVVPKCHPVIPNLANLVADLNKDQDVYRFVKRGMFELSSPSVHLPILQPFRPTFPSCDALLWDSSDVYTSPFGIHFHTLICTMLAQQHDKPSAKP